MYLSWSCALLSSAANRKETEADSQSGLSPEEQLSATTETPSVLTILDKLKELNISAAEKKGHML